MICVIKRNSDGAIFKRIGGCGGKYYAEFITEEEASNPDDYVFGLLIDQEGARSVQEELMDRLNIETTVVPL